MTHDEGDDCGVRLMVCLLLVKALWFVWGRKEKTNSFHFHSSFTFFTFPIYLLLILILVPSLLVVG